MKVAPSQHITHSQYYTFSIERTYLSHIFQPGPPARLNTCLINLGLEMTCVQLELFDPSVYGSAIGSVLNVNVYDVVEILVYGCFFTISLKRS